MRRYSLYIGLLFLCLGCILASVLQINRNNFTFYYDTEYSGDIHLLDDISYEMLVSRGGNYWDVKANGNEFDVTHIKDFEGKFDVEWYNTQPFTISSSFIVHPEDLEANKDNRTCELGYSGYEECKTSMNVSAITVVLYYLNMETDEKSIFAQAEIEAKNDEFIYVEVNEADENNRNMWAYADLETVSIQTTNFYSSSFYSINTFLNDIVVDSSKDNVITIANTHTELDNFTISENLCGLYKIKDNQVTKISNLDIKYSQSLEDRLLMVTERDNECYLGSYDYDGNLKAEILLEQRDDNNYFKYKDGYVYINEKHEFTDFIMVYRYENDKFIEEASFEVNLDLQGYDDVTYKDDNLYVFDAKNSSYIKDSCFELRVFSQKGEQCLSVILKSPFFAGNYVFKEPEYYGNVHGLWDSIVKTNERAYVNHVQMNVN